MDSDLPLLEISGEDDSLIQQTPTLHNDAVKVTGSFFSLSPLQLPISPVHQSMKNNVAPKRPSCSSPKTGNKENMNFNKAEGPKLTPHQMKRRKRGYNLRKSLAWDKAFFTEEGVLDSEELSVISGTYGNSCGEALSAINEERTKSPYSSSKYTFASENLQASSAKKNRNNGGLLLPQHNLPAADKLAPNSRVTQDVHSNSGSSCNRSGVKTGRCPRPLPSSSLKRPAHLHNNKPAKKDSHLPKIPDYKSGPHSLLKTSKISMLGTSQLKHNQIAQPAVNTQKNISFESSCKNVRSTRNKEKSGPKCTQLPAKASAQPSIENNVNSSLEVNLPTNPQVSRIRKPTRSSEVNLKPVIPSSTILSGEGLHKPKAVAGLLPQSTSITVGNESQLQKMKPSGLRMPSPSLGYFGQSNTQPSNIPKCTAIGSQKFVHDFRAPHAPRNTSMDILENSVTAKCLELAASKAAMHKSIKSDSMVSDIKNGNIPLFLDKSSESKRPKHETHGDIVTEENIGRQGKHKDIKEIAYQLNTDVQITNDLRVLESRTCEKSSASEVISAISLAGSQDGKFDINRMTEQPLLNEQTGSVEATPPVQIQESSIDNATSSNVSKPFLCEVSESNPSSSGTIFDQCFMDSAEAYMKDKDASTSMNKPERGKNPNCTKMPQNDAVPFFDEWLASVDGAREEHDDPLMELPEPVKPFTCDANQVPYVESHSLGCDISNDTRRNMEVNDLRSLSSSGAERNSNEFLYKSKHSKQENESNTIVQLSTSSDLIGQLRDHNNNFNIESKSSIFLDALELQIPCLGVEKNYRCNPELYSEEFRGGKVNLSDQFAIQERSKGSKRETNGSEVISALSPAQSQDAEFHINILTEQPPLKAQFDLIHVTPAVDIEDCCTDTHFRHEVVPIDNATSLNAGKPSLGEVSDSLVRYDQALIHESDESDAHNFINNASMECKVETVEVFQNEYTGRIVEESSMLRASSGSEAKCFKYSGFANLERTHEDADEVSGSFVRYDQALIYESDESDAHKFINNATMECKVEAVKVLQNEYTGSIVEGSSMLRASTGTEAECFRYSGFANLERTHEDTDEKDNLSSKSHVKISHWQHTNIIATAEEIEEELNLPSSGTVSDQCSGGGDAYMKDSDAILSMKQSERGTKPNSLIVPPPNAVPFSDEWLAAIEAAGEDILTKKSGAVQNSPPKKSLPEPSPWSPVKRKASEIGPFDCTKCTSTQLADL